MINPELLNSLTDSIEGWMNKNCEGSAWTDNIGYVSHDCSARLATICLLVLEESKLGQDMTEEN